MFVLINNIVIGEDKGKINGEKLVSKINNYLATKYNIIESTIQITMDEELVIC